MRKKYELDGYSLHEPNSFLQTCKGQGGYVHAPISAGKKLTQEGFHCPAIVRQVAKRSRYWSQHQWVGER